MVSTQSSVSFEARNFIISPFFNHAKVHILTSAWVLFQWLAPGSFPTWLIIHFDFSGID